MSHRGRDFRSTRVKLPPEAFAVSIGDDSPPTDLIPKATWTSIISLPDDVSLRTSDHHGSSLARLWELWGYWPCVVGGLQDAAADPTRSPIAHTACDATDYFQASIYNALVGHYRLACTSLRGVVENMTLGIHLELDHDMTTFDDWLGGSERGFGWAADHARQHARVVALERTLRASVGDDLFHQRQPPADEGGLARRLFRTLSKYAHGAPKFNDGDLWQSNGPIYVVEAFESWTDTFLTVYAFGTMLARLAQPSLDKLPWGSPYSARELFTHAVGSLARTSTARTVLEAVPAILS
jgi:hypothetical protein